MAFLQLPTSATSGLVSEANPLPTKSDSFNFNQFGELMTSERTPIIELNSTYGPSAIRDVQTVTGSGAIALDGGEIKLSSGATATSTAQLASGTKIRYMPGYATEVGIGIRIPVLPTGNQRVRWGILENSGNEGLLWNVDATGIYTSRINNGVETKRYQGGWFVDQLNGSGDSGITINLSDAVIFRILFSWYGYGPLVWGIEGQVKNTYVQDFTPADFVRVKGGLSIRQPSLPIVVEVDNGGDASNIEAFVAGRQCSVLGQYVPNYRVTAQASGAVSTGTSTTPIVSMRPKSAFDDRAVLLDSLEALVSSADHIIEAYLNPTLTGASWATPTNYTAAETALEADTSATALSGGTLIYSTLAEGGTGSNRVPLDQVLQYDIPESQILTIAARTLSGTGSVTANLRMRELW